MPVDAAAVLVSICRYLAHIDALVWEESRANKRISEENFEPSSAVNVLPRQSSNPMLVTHLLVACPTKATTLFLGSLQIPFPAGTTAVDLAYMLHGLAGVKLVTQDGSAAASTLVLMGFEFPTTSYSSG